MYEFATYTLFEEYLTVLNQAVDAQRGAGLRDGFTAATLRMLEGRRLGVAIFDENPADPLDYFTVKVVDHSFRLVSHGLEGADATLRLARDYLEDVIAHPDHYAEAQIYGVWDHVAADPGATLH